MNSMSGKEYPNVAKIICSGSILLPIFHRSGLEARTTKYDELTVSIVLTRDINCDCS